MEAALSVHGASGGASGQVLLSDIEMPGEDGYTLVQKARADYRSA